MGRPLVYYSLHLRQSCFYQRYDYSSIQSPIMTTIDFAVFGLQIMHSLMHNIIACETHGDKNLQNIECICY